MIVTYYIPLDADNEPVWPDPNAVPVEWWSVDDNGQRAFAFDNTGVDVTGLTEVTDQAVKDKLKGVGAPLP